MSDLTQRQKAFLRLVGRSESDADGWRPVSETCWPLVSIADLPSDLLEVEPATDQRGARVRLTNAGATVLRYLA